MIKKSNENCPEVPLSVWIEEYAEVNSDVRIREKTVKRIGFILFIVLLVTVLYSYPADAFLKRKDSIEIPILSITIAKDNIGGFLPIIIAVLYILFISSIMEYSDLLSYKGKLRFELYQIKTKGYLQKTSVMESDIGLDGVLIPHYFFYFPFPFKYYNEFDPPRTIRNMLTAKFIWPIQLLFTELTRLVFGIFYALLPFIVIVYLMNLTSPSDWLFDKIGLISLGLMSLFLLNYILTWILQYTFPQMWYHDEIKKLKYQSSSVQRKSHMKPFKLHPEKDKHKKN